MVEAGVRSRVLVIYTLAIEQPEAVHTSRRWVLTGGCHRVRDWPLGVVASLGTSRVREH